MYEGCEGRLIGDEDREVHTEKRYVHLFAAEIPATYESEGEHINLEYELPNPFHPLST